MRKANVYAAGKMPQIKMEWTLGNVLNLVATLVTLIGVIVAATTSYNGLARDIAVMDFRIKQIESSETTRKADHDLLIEIRREVQILRETITGRRTSLEP